MPIRKAKTKAGQKAQIKREAEKLMKSRGLSRTDAFGVATKIVTGKGRKKTKRRRQ